MSRQKGKRGERELALLLRSEGFAARRGVQFQGSPDSPDVVCEALPGIHLEVKRCEAFSLYAALEQAMMDANEMEVTRAIVNSELVDRSKLKIPVVAHRRNDCEWVAVLRMVDLLAILRESTYHKPLDLVSMDNPQERA
jgi:hypothetical protein